MVHVITTTVIPLSVVCNNAHDHNSTFQTVSKDSCYTHQWHYLTFTWVPKLPKFSSQSGVQIYLLTFKQTIEKPNTHKKHRDIKSIF